MVAPAFGAMRLKLEDIHFPSFWLCFMQLDEHVLQWSFWWRNTFLGKELSIVIHQVGLNYESWIQDGLSHDEQVDILAWMWHNLDSNLWARRSLFGIGSSLVWKLGCVYFVVLWGLNFMWMNGDISSWMPTMLCKFRFSCVTCAYAPIVDGIQPSQYHYPQALSFWWGSSFMHFLEVKSDLFFRRKFLDSWWMDVPSPWWPHWERRGEGAKWSPLL